MKQYIFFNNSKSSFALLLILAIILGTSVASASIGRFAPTHDITKNAGCVSCHPEQVDELASTTHLSYFVDNILDVAENVTTPDEVPLTSEDAVTAACIICHGTWGNRERMYVNGYSLEDNTGGTGHYKMVFNSVSISGTPNGTVYNVAVTAKENDQTIILGTDITVKSVIVQNPANSNLIRGELLMPDEDYKYNSTSVTLLATSEKVLNLQSGGGTVKVIYRVNAGEITNLKKVWGDLSARSPMMGVWQSDNGEISDASSVEGYYYAVMESYTYDLINEKKENRQGIYYSHDIAYTSTEYSVKRK